MDEIDHLQRIVESNEYQDFFNGKLKDAGYDSISGMTDAYKKEFFAMIDREWKGEISESVMAMDETFYEAISYLRSKGGKLSIVNPLLDNPTRVLVQSIYNEIDKGLVGTGVEQLFLRSIYKFIYTLANTSEVPIEGNTFDSPQVEFKRAIDGIMKYGKAINFNDLDLSVSTKKSLKRVLLDFKKLKNNGTVFKLLDKIRLIIEVLIKASKDGLYESKLNNLCEAWRI